MTPDTLLPRGKLSVIPTNYRWARDWWCGNGRETDLVMAPGVWLAFDTLYVQEVHNLADWLRVWRLWRSLDYRYAVFAVQAYNVSGTRFWRRRRQGRNGLWTLPMMLKTETRYLCARSAESLNAVLLKAW